MLGVHWLALVACTLTLACSSTLQHDFSPRGARDYGPDATYRSDDPRAARSVLLIPANTMLFVPERGSRGFVPFRPDAALGPTREEYHGPARIFLRPGPHYYVLRVTTSQGVVDFELNLPLAANEHYLLEITESADKVTTSVLKLTEVSYRELYPSNRHLAD